MTQIQIQCRQCGFPFRFADEDVEYGPLCPQCGAYADKVEVLVDVPDAIDGVAALRGGIAAREADYGWFVVDRSGTPIEGPFGGEGDGYRWIMRSKARSDDYPRDSLTVSYLPIAPQYKGTRISDPEAVVERLRGGTVSSQVVAPLDGRVEAPDDQGFWTPDRVIMLAHLEIAAS